MVSYPPSVSGLVGSCVVIPCSFGYPGDRDPEHQITGIWYRDQKVRGTQVYHSDPSQTVSREYAGRTEIVGDLGRGNCTYKIRRLRATDQTKYFFRFEVTGVNDWTDGKGVVVNVAEHLESPRIEAMTEVMELQMVTATCSTRYSCPDQPTLLRWLETNISQGWSLEAWSGPD
uniref:sialoadhesin-like n=1 Tax=Pristiophorus japonicus TaxID=55135 RepID=UPI00398EA09E